MNTNIPFISIIQTPITTDFKVVVNKHTPEREFLDHYQQYSIGVALQKVVESLTEEKKYAASKLGQAINLLNESINNINPIGKWNEEEAGLSASLHNFIRKYEDSNEGSILYDLIKEDRARKVWMTFVKDMLKNSHYKSYNPMNCIQNLDLNTTDERIFRNTLFIWNDNGGIKSALKAMREDYSVLPLLKKNEKSKNII